MLTCDIPMTPHNEPGLATLDGWFVAGASKRGWTTWMVGAVECTDSIYSHSKRERGRKERGREGEREQNNTPGHTFWCCRGSLLALFNVWLDSAQIYKKVYFMVWFSAIGIPARVGVLLPLNYVNTTSTHLRLYADVYSVRARIIFQLIMNSS